MNSDQITKFINTHEQSIIKNYNFEKTYKLKNSILHKHFIINAIGEFNNNSTLENKEFILTKILLDVSLNYITIIFFKKDVFLIMKKFI